MGKTFPCWLESGLENCPFCKGQQPLGTNCDSPVCPICLVVIPVNRTVLCPEHHTEVWA